jgi:hypothetical protein
MSETPGLTSFAAMEVSPGGNHFWLHAAQFIQAHSPLPPAEQGESYQSNT